MYFSLKYIFTQQKTRKYAKNIRIQINLLFRLLVSLFCGWDSDTYPAIICFIKPILV